MHFKNTNNNLSNSRREFLKKTVGLGVGFASGLGVPISAFSATNNANQQSLLVNRVLFNGERRDPVIHHYHLGNGYRNYNPGLMRFHAMDSMSPFGKGGINSYAYCMGDPVNRSDPSGHFLITLLVMAIVGAVIGAAVSAIAQGIKTAVTGEAFDWKQVAIGAAIGFVCGGFGFATSGFAASIGTISTLTTAAVKVGLALTNSAVSALVGMGINIAAGVDHDQAAIGAAIGLGIGLLTAGLAPGFSMAKRAVMRYLERSANKLGGSALGYRYIIYKGSDGQGINGRRLLVTAHGGIDNEAKHTAMNNLNYYTHHGDKLNDPGLRDMMRGIYMPTETIKPGATSYNYEMTSFTKDMTVRTMHQSRFYGIDVVGIRPGWIASVKHLEHTLAKHNLDYAEIDMTICRGTSDPFSIATSARVNPASKLYYGS